VNADNANRQTARIVGALYITGTVAGIMSVVLMGPVRNAQDYLVSVSANETRLVAGALCVLMMGFALAMVPVMMFPILKRCNEALALGYVVFRGGLEAVTYLIIATGWLLLSSMSRTYGQANVSDAADFQVLGTLLLEAKEIGSVLTSVFCVGALMFYSLLYRTKLVPRWLSGWGLVAITPYLAAGLSALFGIIAPLSPTYTLSQLPLALQEMVLALWLIVRGFSSAATVFGAAKTELTGV